MEESLRAAPLTSMQALVQAAHAHMAQKPKRLAVASAEEPHVLEAVAKAMRAGLVRPLLFGDAGRIKQQGQALNLTLEDSALVQVASQAEAATLAVAAVRAGQADVLMKGALDTGTLMRAVLDKTAGLRGGRLMSHVLVFEGTTFGKLFCMSDGAMNIEPDLKAKIQIVENAIVVAHALGLAQPKVAMLAAVEVVNPDMSTAIDDAIISKMGDRGQIKGAIIDGPLALDNAVSKESASIKKINSPVAGDADVFIVDDIDVGNVFYKSLVYFAQTPVAGVIVGAAAPIVLTSRADSSETKFNSIALACLLAARAALPGLQSE